MSQLEYTAVLDLTTITASIYELWLDPNILKDKLKVSNLLHRILAEDEQKWLRNYKWYMYEDNRQD